MRTRLHPVSVALATMSLLTYQACTRQGSVPEAESRQDTVKKILATGLREQQAYRMLAELVADAPHRLSGSPGAAAAVAFARRLMEAQEFDHIHLETVMVPHWIRGSREEAVLLDPRGRPICSLSVCAFGGSVATPREGIIAGVLEVQSFEDLHRLAGATKGKMIFFNRPMDPSKINTFDAYEGAVGQRSRGAIEAAGVGGVAALVRSMTLVEDDVPHTGTMHYADDIPKIPAAALSTVAAHTLSDALTKDHNVQVRLTLSCETLPDTVSANVVGEIAGSEKPEEIVLVGGHLDCWDKGMGAHDDGAGCVQAIEALRLLKHAGIRPKRTIRAVLFMNEENGNRGGKAYVVAPERTGEKHIAALESDRGGFAPRGLSVDGDSLLVEKAKRWESLFELLNAGRIEKGGSGVDVSALVGKGVPGFGLDVESQRYFDYHHSDKDTLDKVNARELELGAIVEAVFCYLVSEEGL